MDCISIGRDTSALDTQIINVSESRCLRSKRTIRIGCPHNDVTLCLGIKWDFFSRGHPDCVAKMLKVLVQPALGPVQREPLTAVFADGFHLDGKQVTEHAQNGVIEDESHITNL